MQFFLKRKKTSIFFAVFALIFGSLLFFHTFFICTLIKVGLSSTLPEIWDWDLSIGSVKYKKKGLVLSTITVTGSQKNEETRFDLLIERLEVSHLFSHPEAYVTHPILFLKGPQQSEKKKRKLSKPLLTSLSRVQIENGEVHFLQYTDVPGPSSCYFSFFGKKSSNLLGTLYLSTHEGEKSPEISMDLMLRPEMLSADLKLNDFNVSWLSDLVHYFQVEKASMGAGKGTMKGMLFFDLDFNLKMENAGGILSFSNLYYQNEKKGLFAKVPKLQTHLFYEKDSSDNPWWDSLILNGDFEKISVAFQSPYPEENIEAESISGKFHLNYSLDPILELSGEMRHQGSLFPFSVCAETLQTEAQSLDLGVKISLLDPQEKLTAIKSKITYRESKWEAAVDATQIDDEKLHLIQKLFSRQSPWAQNISLQKGIIDVGMRAAFEDGRLSQFEVTHAGGKDIALRFKEGDILFYAQNLEAKFSTFEKISKKNFFEEAKWEVFFENSSFEQKGNKVDRLEGHIGMDRGIFSKTHLQGEYKGITLSAQCEGSLPSLNLKLGAKSRLEDLGALLSFEPLKKRAADSIRMELSVQRKPGGIDVEGEFFATSAQGKTGCAAFGMDATQDIFKAVKEFVSFEKLLECVSKAWVKSNGLPHELYSPWLEVFYPIDIHGDFNLDGSYAMGCFSSHLSSPDFSCSAGFGSIAKAALENAKLSFDLRKRLWSGEATVKNALYKEKYSDLDFKNVDTFIKIENDQITAQIFKAQCEGIYLEGSVGFKDLFKPKKLLSVGFNSIEGEAPQFLSVLSRFEEVPKQILPLGGKVSSQKKGFELRGEFTPEKHTIDWNIALMLYEASMTISPSVQLHNLSCDIFFDFKDSELSLEKMQGTLKLTHNEEKSYGIKGQYFRLSQNKGIEFETDMRLESETHDILRLVGGSKSAGEDIEIHFEKEFCHIFGSKLDIEKCILTSDFQLKDLKVKAHIGAHELLSQLQFFFDSGWLPMKSSLMEDFRTLYLDGHLTLDLEIENKLENLVLEMRENGLSYKQKKISPLNLFLKKRGDSWDFQGEFENFASKVHFERDGLSEEKWLIKKASAVWKENILDFGEGSFSFSDHILNLPIEKCTAHPRDFIRFLEEPKLAEALAPLDGDFHIKGTLQAEFWEIANWQIKSELSFFSPDLTSIGLDLRTEKPFFLELYSDKEFYLKDLNMLLSTAENREDPAVVSIPEISLTEGVHWEGEKIKISLPPEFINDFFKEGVSGIYDFQKNLSPSFRKPIEWQNHIEILFSFKKDTQPGSFEGVLKSGYYWIGQKSWLIEDCKLNYDNKGFKAQLTTKFEERFFHLDLFYDPEPQHLLKLYVKDLEEPSAQQGLYLEGRFSPDEGLSLQKIEGKLWGVELAFSPHSKIMHPGIFMLTGSIKVDAGRLSRILPQSYRDVVKQLGMGSGYEIHGDAVIMKDNFSHSFFKGWLKGKDFDFIEYKLNTLLAELSVNHRQVLVKDLNISDDAGIMKISEMRFSRQADGRWLLIIPEITLQDFRPSLLKTGTFDERMKPFMIRDLAFNQIKGYLGDKESFSGSGSFNFVNTFKQDMNLIDIPLEIISRLGLDMGLLIPIKGDLFYEIRSGKIFFTELKNSVSDGKRSHFFLSKQKPSFVEFDGTLNVDVKMKQYVLLKITEPFTLSLRGNLLDPKFSLR